MLLLIRVPRRHERARRELSIENLLVVAELHRRRVELGPETRRRRWAAYEAAARGKPGAAAVTQGRD